ncbi:hypothetical protein EYR38_001880 [Pleurotus pulmonarius]|nr:hypothetical protein EYR38_001880 [Pleurotus pulmonarius]
MARTKQTAKKTTGALAEHADIPKPTTAPRDTGTRSRAAAASPNTFPTITSEELGEDNALCNGCQNGGKMVSCSKCPNWTCYNVAGDDDDGQGCLTVSSAALLDNNTVFVCPACHRNTERLSKSSIPYEGFYTQEMVAIPGAIVDVSCTTLPFFPPMNTKETLLLFIAVEGAQRMDEPAVTTYQLLNQYFGRGQGLLHYASIFFDLATPAGIAAYEADIARTVDFIKEHKCRVVIFFVTHTTPDGDLHFSGPRRANRSKDSPMLPGFSNTPEAVLSSIFTVQLLDGLQLLKEKTSLFLLICGGYLGHAETCSWVDKNVRRKSFGEVISFTSKRFQPFWAASFCARFVHRFYVEEGPYPTAMSEILGGDARLGTATDITIVSHVPDTLVGLKKDLYYWAHNTRMPKVKSHHNYFNEQSMARQLRQFAGGKQIELPPSWRGVAVGQIGNVLRRAYQNIVTLPVTANELSTASHKQRTVLLEDVKLGRVNKATVLVSKDKKPLIVYLPHAIAKHVERKATVATASIDSILAKGMKSKGNWRSERERFKPYGKLPIGQEAFSGGWYAQGHVNSKALPRPSVSLRSPKNSNATEQWLKETATLNKSINLIMGAVHPDSYRAGVKALNGMRTRARPDDVRWAELWQSVATAVAVVSNGTSPAHFDSKGDVKQFDALTNLGADQVELGFPDLGGSFHYHGGSVVLFSGRLFKHEVKDWVSWDDGFFKDCSLDELGLVLYLGHAGERCPAANGEPDTTDPFTLEPRHQSMVFVHTTGIYSRKVEWCQCGNRKSHYTQLLQARLFPATSDRPSTAFTFEVLDELHLQRIECKTASSNFYNLLRRKTDFNSPLDIPDRSREIERASRCYRDLCSRLKTGCWGDEDNAPGQQAIFCPACPQPGINVTSKTWNTATDPDWLLSPLLVADGNFKFDHLQLKNPQSDVALRDGTGFLVTTSTYENHLDVTSGTQEKSNCANHKAVNQALRPRKHVDNTGIGAIACARHGFFVPHSIVNFKKGEQQKNMDFALSEAMKFFTSQKKGPLQPAITVIYDVMCQYGVHLEQRLEDGPFLEKPTMPIQKAIGKFHLGAHIDSCFSKFSLNFLRGAGHTDGEVLETLWAPLNKIAGSTRSMTLAHRQEVLDDCAYDSNWKKITNLSMLSTLIVFNIIKHFHVSVPSLIKKWKRAKTSFAEMKEAYEDLRCRLSEDDLESWNSQAEQASLLRGKALEIYDVKIEQNPSVAGVRLEMVEKELVNGAYLLGGAAFITKGLSLEEAQYKLRVFIKSVGNFPTIPQKNTIADKRRIMKRNIEQHRRQGEKLMGLDSRDNDSGHEMEDSDSDKGEEDGEDEDDYMPGVGSPTADCESIGQTPEQMSICFPSSFTVEERVQMGWTKLAEQEVQLREAQINDALHDLRISLGEKSLRFRKVLRGDRSQKHVTRAWSGINAYDARANLQVDIYEGAVEALKRLGAGNEWKPINRDRDLQMKGDVEHPNRIGQSSHSLAWFWRLQSAEISEEVEDSPMMKEFYRINYLRAKARRDRWEEELILLKKEISWALEWFQYQSDKWSKMADTETSSGLIAHSRKMAFVWKEFRRRGREVVQDSGCVELAQAI